MSLETQLQTEFGDALERLESPTIQGVTPPMVAPRDEEGARELVRFCGREKLAFVAIGNGTKIEIGAPPSRLDLAISTRHLAQITDHDAGNATVETGAGLALADLNAEVRSAQQFVPLDDDGGTLGGAVACNRDGPSRLKWGAPRDLVVGLEAILSDGRRIKGGAKVVKNVAGYDLPKLFVGSFGSLGLITRVTIRLRPNDAASAGWSEAFGSLRDLEARADFILSGPFEPTSLRARWNDENENWVLRARFDGGALAVSEQLKLLPASGQIEAAPASSENWRLRAQLPLTRASNWLELARQNGAQTLIWDAGLGVVVADFADCDAPMVAKLRAPVEDAGGHLRVERAPLELKTPELVWGRARGEVALMRALKAAYDPANVCAPGRLVGGL